MHRTKSGGFSSDEGEMPVEGDGIHPGKKTRRKSEKEMRIFANGIKMKGGTNKRPFLRHITERGYVLSPLLSSLLFLLPGGGSWFRSPERRVGAVTAPRRCGRTAAARWRRHLNDPACVAGAQTHLGAAPWPWPWAEDADDQLLRRYFGDAAAAPVGVVLWWCPPPPRYLPSSAAVST